MTREEILKIEDPNEAMLAIATEKSLSSSEQWHLANEYAEKHNIRASKMAYYPDGRRVLDPRKF